MRKPNLSLEMSQVLDEWEAARDAFWESMHERARADRRRVDGQGNAVGADQAFIVRTMPMAEKTRFSDLVSDPVNVPISRSQKACGNCTHSRDEPTNAHFIRCKAGPPTVVPYMVDGQVALRSEWPALRRTSECDAFELKPIDAG